MNNSPQENLDDTINEIRKLKSKMFHTPDTMDDVVDWLESAIPEGPERASAYVVLGMGLNVMIDHIVGMLGGSSDETK